VQPLFKQALRRLTSLHRLREAPYPAEDRVSRVEHHNNPLRRRPRIART
jgi:hypothetical protein